MPLRFDSPGRVWKRREFLRAGGAALAGSTLVAWPFLGRPESAFARRSVALTDYPFALGVASGDPAPDGMVLWTRLAPRPLEGGGMPAENVEVAWEVADDEGMTKVVAKGTAVATPELAHSVHAEVQGLQPGRWYFYRFTAAGEASPVGRTRTFPRPDETPDRMRLAFTSCQHFEAGYYTAYDHMVREELDFVAHLGDYIYEGGPTDNNIRRHAGPVCRMLDDYRTRHGQYKTDPLLQQAHARFPWLVTWDDHEIANNWAGEYHAGETPEVFLARRAQGFQAYYEHMPLRQASMPRGPDMLLYRNFAFGRLAQIAVLDTRGYRTPQSCGDGNKIPCAETYDPQGTILGNEQEQWLYRNLAGFDGTWNVLAQQVMMARVAHRNRDRERVYSMDQWPGYEVNRRRVLKFFAEHPQLNPIVLTGDIHTNFVNNLQVDESNDQSPVVGAEFVGTSLSSSGDGTQRHRDYDQLLSDNPFTKFYNGERGYVSCEATPGKWTAHYRIVPYVTKPGAPLVTRKTFVVEAGRPGAQEA